MQVVVDMILFIWFASACRGMADISIQGLLQKCILMVIGYWCIMGVVFMIDTKLCLSVLVAFDLSVQEGSHLCCTQKFVDSSIVCCIEEVHDERDVHELLTFYQVHV